MPPDERLRVVAKLPAPVEMTEEQQIQQAALRG
jgi:hypothetical protein